MTIKSVRDLGTTIRGRRRDLGWTQGEFAAKAGVSRKWITELEAGKPGLEIGMVIRVLDHLGLGIDVIDAPSRRRRTVLDDVLERHRG